MKCQVCFEDDAEYMLTETEAIYFCAKCLHKDGDDALE